MDEKSKAGLLILSSITQLQHSLKMDALSLVNYGVG